MATPQDISSEIFSTKTHLEWLQDEVNLKSSRDTVEDIQTIVNSLDQRIMDLRTRGYVFEKELETKASDYAEQWRALQPAISAEINRQSTTLQASIRPLEVQMSQLGAQANNPAAARLLLGSLEAGINMVNDKASSAAHTIDSMYDTFNRQLRGLTSHLDEIDITLKNVAEAKFQLLNTEGAILAVKAVWCQTGKETDDDPEGLIYLTDQRLIFEQKEEKATKKILSIATEKKMVQELEWETPIALVDNIIPSKQGLMKNEDHVDISLAPGAPFQTIHLHIWNEGTEWQQLVNRVKSKEFDKGRAIVINQADLDKVKAAPSQCPACGGNITQVILRGQDIISCEYCGFVIRL
jgi:hypothetical protein